MKAFTKWNKKHIYSNSWVSAVHFYHYVIRLSWCDHST